MRYFTKLNLLAIVLSLISSTYAFDPGSVFEQQAPDLRSSIEEYYNDSHFRYMSNYNLAKYSGYQDLLKERDRWLPAGEGITVLQAESAHTPDDIGDVKHLFKYETSNAHSKYVAGILSKLNDYPFNYTSYKTFSPKLDSFHTATTADLRTFFNLLTSTNTYPATSYDNQSLTVPKLMNISNSNGGSDERVLNQFDKFVAENDMVACTAQNSADSGNWTTSGMAYNSIVVDQQWTNSANYDGAKINSHGAPRYKPDLIAQHIGASSYSSPITCSAAAVLLGRVNADPVMSNAYNSIVIKAILMAGATRFNYRASTEWGDGVSQISRPLFSNGEWERTSDEQPLSYKYGAGSLNILTAYNILEAGEFDPESLAPVGASGWSYQADIAEGAVKTYRLSVAEPVMFSALLAWHRAIDDSLKSQLPDYTMSLYDSYENRVAFSDNTTSNIELIEHPLPAGNYTLKVVLKSADGLSGAAYGLAWVSKKILAPVTTFVKQKDGDSWRLSWGFDNKDINVKDYKYRLLVSASEDFSSILNEYYLDNSHSYIYRSADPVNNELYFNLYTYPKDSDVAYFYPSLTGIIRSRLPILLYTTGITQPSFGHYGGATDTREGVNNFCKANLPDSYHKEYRHTLAFLTVSQNDTIKNFDTLYGLDASRRVVGTTGLTIKDSWANLISRGPDISFKTALDMDSSTFWSQTYGDGTVLSSLDATPEHSCNHFTSTRSRHLISLGFSDVFYYGDSVSPGWIGSPIYSPCDSSHHVICIAY